LTHSFHRQLETGFLTLSFHMQLETGFLSHSFRTCNLKLAFCPIRFSGNWKYFYRVCYPHCIIREPEGSPELLSQNETD
jgi:hypothetical protein